MKTVYFVRHGESESNAGLIQQGPESPLTEKGKKQAAHIAERCSKLPVEIIISSTMRRAEETADAIHKRIGKPVEFTGIFVERRRPSEQVGLARNDPKMLKIDRAVAEAFIVPGSRFSDEESFDDLKVRAERALAFLADRIEKRILVITHGFFLRVILARILFGEDLTAIECDRIIRVFETENTGLTVFRYDSRSTRAPWRLFVWNDHAHLG